MTKFWQGILLPQEDEELAWELFHENSKVARHSGALSKEEVRARMNEFHESLPFHGYPVVDLPRTLFPLNLPLDEVLVTRVSVREFNPCSLSLESLATILHYAYGVTRDNEGTLFPRPLRIVPSGGALYPLEIFFHTINATGLDVGLYHYNPMMNNLRLLCKGDLTRRIAGAMVYPNLVVNASVIFFLTAIFERSVFKYGNRGYRFILLEGGHVAQNVNLVANALGLGSVNIGGYFDREIDDLLGLDGITHSTIYMIAIGKNQKPRAMKLD